MALNLNYIPLYYIDQYLVDKDTGKPLSSGTIKFFRDAAHTEEKDVFILSGSPPNYTYTNIGSVVDINSVGEPTYNNNPIVIYTFPYLADGVTPDLYFYEVYNGNDEFQFSRQGQPNVGATSDNTTITENFIPNGQFALHNNLAATDIAPLYDVGEIRQGITYIAPGGWTFERPSDSTAKDIVTFEEFNSFIATPPPDGNPAFSLRVINETPDSGDTFKDIRIKFTNVNKFASATDQYTYGFTGESNTEGTQEVSLFLIKNYGTNGSPTVENQITTFTLGTTWGRQFFTFSFGTNEGETIATDGSDFLQIAIRLPLTTVFDLSVTCFLMDKGQITNPIFPPTTDSKFIYQSLTVPIPDYNGFSLYLPRINTLAGEIYDDAEIGDVIAESQISVYDQDTGFHPTSNRVLAKGLQYETISYSPLGVPMARLQSKYFDTNLNAPIYGTGLDYFTAVYFGSGNQLLLTTNTEGAVTATSDGAGPLATGFTFATIHTGATTYYTKAYMTASSSMSATFWIELLEYASISPPFVIDANNSGFTVGNVQDINGIGASVTDLKQIYAVVVSGVPTAGHYFSLISVHADVAVKLAFWFKVDGVGSAPSVPGFTLVEIDLLSTDTPPIIAEKNREAINGWQQTTILTVAGSAIPAGAYFEAYSTTSGGTQLYVPWYTVDGMGTQPVIANAIYIKVPVLSTDTNAQVAFKTQTAINSRYFATPDPRNGFLRAWNNSKTTDQDVHQRFSIVPGIIGDTLGTFQLSNNLDHRHYTSLPLGAGIDSVGVLGLDVPAQGAFLFNAGDGVQSLYAADYTGFIYPDFSHFESRPVNMFVNYVIKY